MLLLSLKTTATHPSIVLVVTNKLTHTFGKVFISSSVSVVASSPKIVLYSAPSRWAGCVQTRRRHRRKPHRCGNIVLKVSRINVSPQSVTMAHGYDE
jgi:hypothetical protein